VDHLLCDSEFYIDPRRGVSADDSYSRHVTPIMAELPDRFGYRWLI
jgi:hypothetical protein